MSSSEQTAEPVNLLNRIINKALTTQFCWWLGNVSILWNSFFYYLYLFSSQDTSKLYYKSLWGAILSYAIVLAATVKNFQPNADFAFRLFKDETFLYFALAVIWRFNPSNIVLLIPYVIYSIFHCANYLKSDIIPTIFPHVAQEFEAHQSNPNQSVSQPTQLALALQSKVNQFYSPAIKFGALYEVTVIPFYVIIGFVTRFQIIKLVVYTGFIYFRYGQSQLTQSSFTELRLRLDALVLKPGVPESAQRVYKLVQDQLISLGQRSIQFNAHGKTR